MSLELESLRLPYLTNVEVGQLMVRHFTDLNTIDPLLRIDVPYNAYITDMTAKMMNYQKGLLQAQKSAETELIALADAVRDKAVGAFGSALKLYTKSDDSDEVEACRCISILFGPFKKLNTLNYEAETLAIDKLVVDLQSPTYSGYVTTLQMERYVNRMNDANNEFRPLFGGRMVDSALTESFDMKVLRTELLRKYSDFVQYVLSMAKATNLPLFLTSLDMLNTARKYYNDQLAQPTKPKEEVPVG
ncbi:MAG TPA: hypothetical protein DCL77_14710 [Prolixibacteraceae bacterium]|jgi:hypothetical protein|nr:hypothetical protein [Prolixibacteraceae bacterium]